MKLSKMAYVLLASGGLVLAGCGFVTYKPGELSNDGSAMTECATTKLNGIVVSVREIDLIEPNDARNSMKFKYPFFPKGSVIKLASLSSRWTMDNGHFITAYARIPSMRNRMFYIMRYHDPNKSPDKNDFENFLVENFQPCK